MSPTNGKVLRKVSLDFPSTQPLIFVLLSTRFFVHFRLCLVSRIYVSPADFHADSVLFFLLRPFLERKGVKCDKERNSSKGESVSLHRVIFEIPRRPRDSLAFFPFSRLFYFSLRLCSSYSIPRASPSFLSSSRVVSLDGIPVSSVKRACDEGFPLFRSLRHPGTKKEGQ